MSRAPRASGTARLGPGAEFDLIRRFLEPVAAAGAAEPAPLAADRILVGPGDDCAVIAGGRIALSTDLSVEGVHFLREWLEPAEIGHRAVAAALSDLAAVAAQPVGILVSLAAPERDVPEAAAAVMAGAREAGIAAGAPLLGGDVSRSPGPLLIDVTVVGDAAAPVLRSGARPGDSLWVTGTLGAAAAAVTAWRRGGRPPPDARAAFARPRPRIREAIWLLERVAPHAMIDLSDGLTGDAAHIAAAGSVAAVLDPGRVPVHHAASTVAGDPDAALRLALGGGEDYELLVAAAAGGIEPLAAAFTAEFELPLTRVGEIRSGGGVHLLGNDGGTRPLDLAGYRHFQGGPA